MSYPLRILCDQGTHCQTCRRDDDAGRAWRASLVAAYATPEGWPGAAGCPRGLALGAVVCGRCGGPHGVKDCPIPPDTSPEIERRRAQAGGCCGAPPPAATPGDE